MEQNLWSNSPGREVFKPKFKPSETREQVTWDQALFSFRFENYIPAGKAKISAVAVRENVWEPLKLGLISG